MLSANEIAANLLITPLGFSPLVNASKEFLPVIIYLPITKSITIRLRIQRPYNHFDNCGDFIGYDIDF